VYTKGLGVIYGILPLAGDDREVTGQVGGFVKAPYTFCHKFVGLRFFLGFEWSKGDDRKGGSCTQCHIWRSSTISWCQCQDTLIQGQDTHRLVLTGTKLSHLKWLLYFAHISAWPFSWIYMHFQDPMRGNYEMLSDMLAVIHADNEGEKLRESRAVSCRRLLPEILLKCASKVSPF